VEQLKRDGPLQHFPWTVTASISYYHCVVSLFHRDPKIGTALDATLRDRIHKAWRAWSSLRLTLR
jgi:hypothetical protein